MFRAPCSHFSSRMMLGKMHIKLRPFQRHNAHSIHTKMCGYCCYCIVITYQYGWPGLAWLGLVDRRICLQAQLRFHSIRFSFSLFSFFPVHSFERKKNYYRKQKPYIYHALCFVHSFSLPASIYRAYQIKMPVFVH